MKQHTIITVSRQYGSGGREVCEYLSKKLGIPYFDREILTQAAKKIGIEEADYDTLNRMSYKTERITFGFDATFPRDAVQISDSHQMFLQQSAIIRKIAEEGSGIFLGRCADFILKDEPNCYSFYTYADDKFRERRAKETYHMTWKELQKTEKHRSVYYRFHTGGRELGDPLNYDLMCNIGKIGIQQCAGLIADYVKQKNLNKGNDRR